MCHSIKHLILLTISASQQAYEGEDPHFKDKAFEILKIFQYTTSK